MTPAADPRHRRRHGLRAVAWIVAAIALAAGVALMSFSGWGLPVLEAEDAVTAGEFTRALERYREIQARFERWPITQRVFPRVYQGAIDNQLALQFALGQLDPLIERADAVPQSASTHFWLGLALFEKSRAEEEADARLGWLGRSVDEFRLALETEPSNWDVKYNYELSKRLYEELRKNPKTPPNQLLQLLRPQPKEGSRPVRRVG